MRYALLDKKVWEILQTNGDQLLLERNKDIIEVLRSELNLIYPELEAIKLLEKCKPHIKNMKSLSDIEEFADIDSNMLLPFAEDYSAADTELTDFLNLTIRHIGCMLEASPNRQDYNSIELTGKPHDLSAVVDAFNQEHPKVNTLEITWENQQCEIYICTQAICHAESAIGIPTNYEEEMKKFLPVFLNRTVEEGAKLLWANVVLANIDPLKIDAFEDIKDGHMHMPFGDDDRIHGETSIKIEYLDWAVEVINEFNELIVKTQLKNLINQGITNGPTFEALTRAKKSIHFPN